MSSPIGSSSVTRIAGHVSSTLFSQHLINIASSTGRCNTS
jgi:hypothetical protein